MAKKLGLPKIDESVFNHLAWLGLARTMNKVLERLDLQTPNAAEPANEAVQRYREVTVFKLPASEKGGAVTCPGCGELKVEELVHCTKCGTFLPR